jgi:hypothetical protein
MARHEATARSAIAGMALLLSACEAPSSGMTASTMIGAQPLANVAPVEFRCPADGTRVVTNNDTTTYRGADPADPLVCLSSTATDPQRRHLYNYWTLPAPAEADLRRGMAAVWPAAPGRRATFTVVRTDNTGRTWQYNETFHVERAERVVLAAAPRDTLVITRTTRGLGGNTFLGTNTYWYDPASGVFLKRTVQISGRSTSTVPQFEAVALEQPATAQR